LQQAKQQGAATLVGFAHPTKSGSLRPENPWACESSKCREIENLLLHWTKNKKIENRFCGSRQENHVECWGEIEYCTERMV